MHTQQLMAALGRSSLASSGSLMWSSKAEEMPVSWEAGRCHFTLFLIHTTSPLIQRVASRYAWLCCSDCCLPRAHWGLFKGHNVFFKAAATAGAGMGDLFVNQRTQVKAAVGLMREAPKPKPPEGDNSRRLVQKQDPWSLCRQNLPLKWQFLFSWCAGGLFKEQKRLPLGWKAWPATGIVEKETHMCSRGYGSQLDLSSLSCILISLQIWQDRRPVLVDLVDGLPQRQWYTTLYCMFIGYYCYKIWSITYKFN